MVAGYGDPPDVWVEHAARRVSKLAFWSVIALAITGIYTAYNGLGFDLYRLLFSAYGRTLIAKIIVFIGIVAIGAYNRYWLVPNIGDPTAREILLRNVRLESLVLLFAVVGLASLLANTPPAHGMRGHAGHAMMAMITAGPTKRLSSDSRTKAWAFLIVIVMALALGFCNLEACGRSKFSRLRPMRVRRRRLPSGVFKWTRPNKDQSPYRF
jgi:hypothetical protein